MVKVKVKVCRYRHGSVYQQGCRLTALVQHQQSSLCNMHHVTLKHFSDTFCAIQTCHLHKCCSQSTTGYQSGVHAGFQCRALSDTPAEYLCANLGRFSGPIYTQGQQTETANCGGQLLLIRQQFPCASPNIPAINEDMLCTHLWTQTLETYDQLSGLFGTKGNQFVNTILQSIEMVNCRRLHQLVNFASASARVLQLTAAVI